MTRFVRVAGLILAIAAAAHRYGSFAGVLRTNERYGVVLQNGSMLTRRVNAAVRALVANER